MVGIAQVQDAEGFTAATRTSHGMDTARKETGPLASLRQALEQQEFRLAYQPIIDLRNRAPIGFEALIRWPRANIGPDVFIPVAEHGGLIREITRSVCRQAAQDRVTRCASGQVWLSINLSAADAESMETVALLATLDRKSTRLNSSHVKSSYA